jgi:2-keto-4-pentenoate hydratase
MDARAIEQAARMLARAWRTGERLERLPEACRPRNGAEAVAIQAAVLAELGETVAGWKVSLSQQFGLMIGLLPRSRVFANGAVVDASPFSMLGIEAEIAFRFERSLPAREAPYERAEIEAAVTAFPAIEIVDTRFQSYEGAHVLDRAADFISHGGFVAGPGRSGWQGFDLESIEATVTINGVERVRRSGGHPLRDPLLPAIALVNHLRHSTGALAGAFVTTGTYTGLERAFAGDVVEARFEGLGSVEVRFVGELAKPA